MTVTPIRIRQQLALSVALAAVVGSVLLPATAASAAIPTVIDVGYTINDHGVWKGSGSYSNGSGKYVRWCVRLMRDSIGPNDADLTLRGNASWEPGHDECSRQKLHQR